MRELRTEKPWRGDEGPGFNSRRLHLKRTFYKVERPLFRFVATLRDLAPFGISEQPRHG